MKINPYLNFKGNTEEAFNFYKSVFGGEFAMLMRYKDAPAEACGEMKVAEHELERIMHIALPIGDGNILMANDALESMCENSDVSNTFSLSIGADSREEVDRLYQALSEGGSWQMPPADAFWGDYFGMCVDKFGVRWMFSYREGNSK